MTYLIAFGLLLVGICFGVILENALSGASHSDLEQELFIKEIELERLRRGAGL